MVSQAQTQQIPLLILQQGVQRTKGKDAQKMNILAAKSVADIVKSTLGPKGMDKMLVDSLGDIIVTNDGVTILEEMDIDHPTAKMMVEVAKTQQNEIGDGTTTAVVIAGELLKRAEDLLEQKIHPTIIVEGYRMALEAAQSHLCKIAQPININETSKIENVAITAMTGKSAEGAKKYLGKLVTEAIKYVSEEREGKIFIDKTNIKLEKKEGGGIFDSKLIKGLVFDKERVHPDMPSLVENAKIALVNAPLEVKKTEVDTKINIHDPATLTAFLKKEESMLYKMVQKVKQSGANVLFCQKGIDDIAQHFLAKENIFAVRRVKKSDLEKLAKATGGNIVTSLDDLSPKDIGSAKFVEQRKIGDENYIFVEECKNPKAVTLFIRGGSEHVVKEIEKALEDAIDDTASALNYGKILAGGGASEIEIAKKLRSYAERIGGKKQLAIKAFAKALEVCPSILAENAGLDPVEKLMALRKVHEDEGKVWWGINVESGTIVDMWKDGVLEPLKLKLQALQSASEVTEMILRVDDVVTAKELEKGKEGPMGGGPCGGGPCGPGGMPPY